MKFNFRKIASVLASAVMLGSTAGVALAANYPAPLVVSGTEDGAIVVGSVAAGSDWAAATDAAQALNKLVTTSTTEGSVTGESYKLYSGSTKIYMNDSIKTVRSSLTDTELPILLKDGDFSGNVEADYWQSIQLGSTPRLNFSQAPTSSDNPVVSIALGTSSTSYTYNATVTFDQAVNFTHADSEGESMNLFGAKYTVGSATDGTNIVLFKSSQTVTLGIGGDSPSSTTVTVDNKDYTAELVSASDTSATIKITDSDGNSESKTVSEDASKKIQGLEVSVETADESNFQLIATLNLGAQKVKLTDGSQVKLGSDEDPIEGTEVDFGTGNPNNITTMTVSVYAEDSDHDAILEGSSLVDPAYGSFKIDFVGTNMPENSTEREVIEIKPSGNEKATIKMKTHGGDEDTKNWYYNDSATIRLADSTGKRIHVMEMERVNRTEYIVVGNEDEGYLLKVLTITNSTGYDSDSVILQDAFNSATTFTATITAESSGTIGLGGRTYTLVYARGTGEDGYITLNYPDSATAANDAVIYPTIETSKGAKVAFYEPLTINLSAWDRSVNNLTTIRFPDGDGYTDVTLANVDNSAEEQGWNITCSTGTTNLNTSAVANTDSVKCVVGPISYNFTSTADTNITILRLLDAAGTANVGNASIIIFEERDDNSNYEAMIVSMEGQGTSTDGSGISDVERTWGKDGTWDNLQLETDDDLYKEMDLWGSIVTIDKSDTDQHSAKISYPDDQVYGDIRVSEVASSFTQAGVGGKGGQVLVVKDSEVSSVKTKNLVVVGGSCVNSVARKIVDATATSAVCGADWTAKTTVGAGQYIIKAVKASEAVEGGSESKVAVLVAGYEAADTVNAVNKLKEAHTTDIGSKVYPITSA